MFDFENSKRFSGKMVLSLQHRWRKRWTAEQVWNAAVENGAVHQNGERRVIARMPGDAEEKRYSFEDLKRIETQNSARTEEARE